MSGYIEMPSFWDYLGQGLTRGHQSFLGERDRREELRQRKLQEDMQAFQTAMQYGDVESAQRLAGMIPTLQGVKLQETPNQIRGRLTKQKATELPFVPGLINKTTIQPGSDDERRVAGLPTSLDIMKEGAERQTIQDNTKNFARDKQLERWSKISPALTMFANNYVATQLSNSGGRIDPKRMGAMTEAAYQQWIKEAQQQGFGNMTPQDAQQAKQFFGAAMQAAYQQQVENDIRRIAAMPSNQFRDNTAPLLNAMNNLAKTKWDEVEPLQKQMGELMKNPMLSLALKMKPEDIERNPLLAGQLQMYQQLQGQITERTKAAQALQNAAAALAAGRLAPEAAGQFMQQFIAPAMPEQVTGQPQQEGPGMPYQPMAGQTPPPPVAGMGPPPSGTKRPLSDSEKAQAQRNPQFKNWLRSKGYTDSEM